MSEPNRSMSELPGLLDERRTYEGWLSALDARRELTPAHVFERVKADYETRLRRVQEELSAHRHAIEEERTSLSSRRSLVEADEQLRRDERAELELRLHVGEIAGEEADSSFRVVDESLERLVGEREELAKRIADLELLLEPARVEAAAVTTDAAAETAGSEEPVSVDGAPSDVVGTDGSQHAEVAAVAAAADDVAGADDADPTESVGHIATAPESPTESAAAEDVDRTAEYATTLAADIVVAGDVGDTNSGVAGADQSPPRDPRNTPSGGFDELAFLNNLVGDGAPPKTNGSDDAAADSLLAGLGEPGQRRSGERPLASNIPGHTPIVLRATSGAGEHVKTLKCSECGASNYPTEWYCERCGAELAAL